MIFFFVTLLLLTQYNEVLFFSLFLYVCECVSFFLFFFFSSISSMFLSCQYF